MQSFAKVFKKYRLRAEFETFAEFGKALAEKGYFYDDSIFSHWQKGTRSPSNRQLLLKIIEIFKEREAITSPDQANELLSSAGLGYLTEKEKEFFHFSSLVSIPFQVPSEIAYFTGREEIVRNIEKEIPNGKIFLLYGSPGVGKTALAIKVGHLLRNKFPDGVLWYRMDVSNIKDVLISIAHILKQDLPKSSDIEVIASFVRSVLAQKKVLIIFDNVDVKSNIHLLLPNATVSSLLIISRLKNLYLPGVINTISLESFNNIETLKLFERILGKQDLKKNKSIFLQLGYSVGNLPLAVDLLASQLKASSLSPQTLLKQIENTEILLQNLSYENKNLYLALQISYKNLSQEEQNIFLSLGIFEGKDFSTEAIAYMNGVKTEKAKKLLDGLYNASLIENSLNNKFRIHPMIKKFIGEKLNNPYSSLLTKITLILFGILTIFWVILQMKIVPWKLADIFSSTYFIVPLWGALWAGSLANKWRGIKSIMGKTMLVFSLGLLCQVMGQVSYAAYVHILHIQIPYPSLGDLGYFGSTLCYLYGIFLLFKVASIKFKVGLILKHIYASIIYVICLLIGILIFLQSYVFQFSDMLKLFLDLWYPIVGIVNFYIALLLYLELKNNNKNILKDKIVFFVFALLVQFLSDAVFIYQANLETWTGGQVNDYMYLLGYLFMTLAILKLNSHLFNLITK